MSNKTCGECKHFELDEIAAICHKHCLICNDDAPACEVFEPKVITNGDRIQQGGNRAIAKFAYKTARTHICGTCAFATIENGRYVYTAKDGQSCVDGIEAWLNAPAESQLNDAIQNVIKDGAKTAIDIHEAAYTPDMNVATKESEVKDE